MGLVGNGRVFSRSYGVRNILAVTPSSFDLSVKGSRVQSELNVFERSLYLDTPIANGEYQKLWCELVTGNFVPTENAFRDFPETVLEFLTILEFNHLDLGYEMVCRRSILLQLPIVGWVSE